MAKIKTATQKARSESIKTDSGHYQSAAFTDGPALTDILEKIKKATKNVELLQNVKVTPEIAHDLLTINQGNRPLRLADVTKYAEEMKEGLWRFTGQIIRISIVPRIIDGQHTLWACYKSKQPIFLHIQCGLQDEAFAVLDNGRSRTGGDIMALANYTHYNTMAAAIKSVIYWSSYGKVGAAISRKKVGNQTILEWTKQNDADFMVKSIDYSVNTLWPKAKFLNQSTWAFLFYIFSKKSKFDANEFLTRLSNGQELSPTKNAPIYLLREKLVNFKKEQKKEASLIRTIKMAYIFTAWNHYRNNQMRITKLQIDKNTNDLPKIV